MVSLHLLLRAFLDAVGYGEEHHGIQDDFDAIAMQFKTEIVPTTLSGWIGRQILADPERVTKIKNALANRGERSARAGARPV